MKIKYGLAKFINFLKSIFWKLPISNSLKEKMREKYFVHKMKKESSNENLSVNEISLLKDEKAKNEYIKQVLSISTQKSDEYCEYKEYKAYKGDVVLAAFYLTQFHPNKQNDEWWGKGTTEWNNVSKAVPQYVGHYQPRLPLELGYYDLRIKENIKRQIELAKNYGIGAFCFYYYWFDGERLLEQPLNMFLNNKDLDIPFFYCWANENWTKRFSGTNSDILMKITQTEENYISFIYSVLSDFEDERYYKINNKPVLSVYRPQLIPNVTSVIKEWRKIVNEEIGKDIYLIAVQERGTNKDWIKEGFDAESEFQPKQIEHNCKNIISSLSIIRDDFDGQIYDYKDMVDNKKYYIENSMKRKVYSAVTPMWDNTARRNNRGLIFHGSTPTYYKEWLSDIITKTKQREILDSPLIFINAWNEWGEGAYLEPDRYFGYAYLDATRKALDDDNI